VRDVLLPPARLSGTCGSGLGNSESGSMRGGGSPTLPLIAALAFQASGRAGEADADKGLGFVELDAQAKQLVGNAARERAGHGRGIIIPLFSNSGFMSFLRNLICSMRRLSVNNWIVIGMDNRTCPALMGSPGRGEQSECVFPYGEGGGVTSQTGVATYRSVAFNRMVMQRPLWVQFLLREGYTVVQCDLDIVWLRDPLPIIRNGIVVNQGGKAILLANESAEALRRTLATDDHLPNMVLGRRLSSRPKVKSDVKFRSGAMVDMAFQSEQAYGLNGGFYFARPTANTLAFFDDWLQHLHMMINSPSFEEQHALNGAVNRIRRLPNRSLHFARFAEREFPNGKLWWSYPMEVDKRTSYLVHVNWVKQQKRSRMMRDGLWFLDATDKNCADGFDPMAAAGYPTCTKLCAPISYAPMNASAPKILKRCDQMNREDDFVLNHKVARDYNRTGAFPAAMANLFWHPIAYAAVPTDCPKGSTRGAQPACKPCQRRLTLPLAAAAFESAFGSAALARGAPQVTYENI
jgi:hypothetical protein